MKKSILLIILCSFITLQLIAQAEKTLVKSVDLNGNMAVAAVLSGNTTVNEWDKDFIRITTRIELTNSNVSILERLVSVGRYEITVIENGGEMTLAMPKAATAVNLKGTVLVEKFSYEITVPKKVSIRVETPETEGI